MQRFFKSRIYKTHHVLNTHLQKRTIKGLPFQISQAEACKKASSKWTASYTEVKKHYVPFWKFQIQEPVRFTAILEKTGRFEERQFSIPTNAQFIFYASETFDRPKMNGLNPDFDTIQKLQKASDIELDLYSIDEETSLQLCHPDIILVLTEECEKYARSQGLTDFKIKDIKYNHVAHMYYCSMWEIHVREDSKTSFTRYINGHSGVVSVAQNSFMYSTWVFVAGFALADVGLLTRMPILAAYSVLLLGTVFWEWMIWYPTWKRYSKFDRTEAARKAHLERDRKSQEKMERKQQEANRQQTYQQQAGWKSWDRNQEQYTHKEYSGKYDGSSSSSSSSYGSSSSSNRSSSSSSTGSSKSSTKSSEKSYDFTSMDEYAILGLSKYQSPTSSAIKSAFLKEAKKWHPDLCRNVDEMAYYNARFKAINQAYMKLRK